MDSEHFGAMNESEDVRWKQRFENFDRALQSLRRAGSSPRSVN
jgi:hypothetical protein